MKFEYYDIICDNQNYQILVFIKILVQFRKQSKIKTFKNTINSIIF